MIQLTGDTGKTHAANVFMVGLLLTALASCDNQPTGSPAAAPGTPPATPSTPPATPSAAAAGETRPADVTTSASPAEGAPAGSEPATGPAAADTPPDASTTTPPAAPAAAGPDASPQEVAAGQRHSLGELSFELAEGWTLKPATGMRLGTVTDGEVEIALSSFGGDVGGKLANVNRWRQQVGLPQITEADLERETRTIEIDGKQVMIVDALGPEMRLLAASIPGDGKLFFARLVGPAETIGSRKDAFEAFVKSIKVE